MKKILAKLKSKLTLNNSDDWTPLNMEKIFLRFPHIGNQIFEELTNESFVKCREVSKSWRNFHEEKMVHIRNLLIVIGFSTVLMRKTLLKEATEKLKEYSEIANFHLRARFFRIRGLIHTLIEMDGSDSIESPSFNLIKLIMENSEDKNPVDINGLSALENAAFFNKAAIYQLIMDYNEDKNPTIEYPIDPENTSPLHLAASLGNFEVCKLIIGNIQDPNPTSYLGETPLGIARQKGHGKICRLIECALLKQRRLE